MAHKLMGRKRGMTQFFDKDGNVLPCTIIELEKNVVTQIKTQESDGYNAVQIAFEKIQANDPRTVLSRVKKPQLGLFEKHNIVPRRHLAEMLVDNPTEFSVGQELGVEFFNEIKFVDVMGVSRGKGYQGVMKLFNFSGGPASHGSGFHRHHGSTGMRTTPGRCFPGGRRASHMGTDRVTVQNLKVVKVDEQENILIVCGAVPGPVDGLVCISQAEKKR